MNKQQLFMAGSALLATTSLAGVAQAGIVTTKAATTAGTALANTTFSGVKIANTIFSTTASTANAVQVGPTSIYIKFSNVFTPTTKFSVEIDPINASFVTSGMSANLILGSAGTFGGSVSATAGCTSVTPLTTKIILDNCGNAAGAATNGNNADVSASYVGVTLTGVTFNNASGLAAVGGTVGISGFVYNPTNAASVYENITAANVLSAVSPIITTVTAGATTTVLTGSTPIAFAYFDSATDIRTAALASVNITGVGAYDKDLTSIVTGTSTVPAGQVAAVSSINVTVTSSALSQAAVTSVSVAGTSVAIFNGSVSNFSAGVATFSINLAGGYDSFAIQVSFSGTAAISAASAGTVTVVHGSGQGNLVQAVPAVTGKTGSISLGGFSAELNTFLSSTNASFASFARIHNNGLVAASVTVTVKNDATGATLGTYTTSSIATGQTLQISAKDIETGAGITAALGLNYTLNLQGAFSGYAQHIIFNPATGQLADLSSFRNKGAAGSTSP